MNTIFIKPINISIVDKEFTINLDNPNYKQYNFDFDSSDTYESIIKELMDKVFQDFCPYELVKTTDTEFVLTVNNIDISIGYKKDCIISTCFFIDTKQRASSLKLLTSIMNHVLLEEKLQVIKEDIANKFSNLSADFKYRYEYDSNNKYDSNDYKYHYIFKYIPNLRNILVKYVDGKFEFLNYLEFEGETYNCGNEIISEEYLHTEIAYWSKLLSDIPVIKQKLSEL